MLSIPRAYLVKRTLPLFLKVCLSLVLFQGAIAPAIAEKNPKDRWTRIRSRNFLLVGNANEQDIREVAARLEQFREGFTRLLTGFRFNTGASTTVVVFKSNEAFDPYKPVYQGKPGNVAGYFQSGEDVNYITLTTERRTDDPYRVIFHEYVHLLLHNTLRNLPPWFDEGLAEYYSTFYTADEGRQVRLGRVIPGHLQLLRTNPWLPIQTLLAVDRKSPYYNERDKTGIFYAESWALVHYLILGNHQERRRELGAFLDLLNSGAKAERAFQEAFKTDPQTLDEELRAYVERNTFPQQVASLPESIGSTAELTTSKLSESEALAFLGDLLLHIDRLDRAGATLQRAIGIDPRQAFAHASLAVVRIKQRRFTEAVEHLKKSEAANPDNYLIHYYHAFALSRAAMDDGLAVSTYNVETVSKMRAELRRAIELNPEFPESYALLAFINLVRVEQLDESIQLVKRALALAPGRDDYLFVLAQLYVRKEDFSTARQVLQPMLRENADETIRRSALTLLSSMNKIEEQLNRLKAAGVPDAVANESDSATDSNESSLEPFLRKPQKGEQRVQGFLNRIECSQGSTTFSIDTGAKVATLHASGLERVRFVTFTPGIRGEITCGVRQPPNPVVVTFRNSGRDATYGEVVAIEFVPADFQLRKP